MSITHTPVPGSREGTFDLVIDARRVGYLSYAILDDGTMVVDYVEVNPELRGKSHGEALVGAAVEWARASGRKVRPLCSYARAVMHRKAAWHDLLS